MKESKFVKTKIVAGYLLLIAVCILSVGYVYRVAVRFSAPDRSYALLHTKRSAVNRTLYHLYQAESYGQLMIAGYQSYEARYKRELRTVRQPVANSCMVFLMMRSSSEWKEITASRPPGFRCSVAASSMGGSASSSPLTAMRMA